MPTLWTHLWENLSWLTQILSKIICYSNIIFRIPSRGAIYSINEGNSLHWDDPIKEYVNSKKFPDDG